MNKANNNKMDDKKNQYPEGHFTGMWIGIGMAMFTGLGIPLAFALDNMAFIGIGPAIGVSVGVAIGASIEAQKKKEGLIRELNDKEKKTRKIATYIAIGLLFAGLIVLLATYLVSKFN